jgi:hypothetical protein
MPIVPAEKTAKRLLTRDSPLMDLLRGMNA